MRTTLVDDHLLRDVLSDSLSPAATAALSETAIATTNLWYVRLCRSVAAARGGRITGALDTDQRQALGAHLVQLDDAVVVQPMIDLAWNIATLSTKYRLSTLGAEAVAAALFHDATILVWSGDDGPNLRAACADLEIDYASVG